MRKPLIGAAVLATIAFAMASSLSAQQSTPAPAQATDQDQPGQAVSPNPAKHPRAKKPVVSQTNPDLDTEDQLAPSQMNQKMPGAVSEPTSVPVKPSRPAVSATAAPRPAAAKGAPAGARVVACSGLFAKDSSHLKLAMSYESKNVTFAEVDANGGTKVQASILFANDPARRLEVWWSNPAARSGTYLIVINGKSTWTAPGGMKLGLTLAQLEKLNHKPFKVKGFDKEGVATVSDWDGGALADLPGGCKSGLSLHADPKASADAIAGAPADQEFGSSDAAIRAGKPTVSEILIGY